MASFNQSPLGQATISTGFVTTLVSGNSTVNAVITASTFTSAVNATGNAATWYAPSSAVQSEGRRESKMIGLPRSNKV